MASGATGFWPSRYDTLTAVVCASTQAGHSVDSPSSNAGQTGSRHAMRTMIRSPPYAVLTAYV